MESVVDVVVVAAVAVVDVVLSVVDLNAVVFASAVAV